ncbi:heparinase II/III family protein [Paenarthrobacter ilicis]|uniref:heparinase II/III domain-containing protein n=1 Tax=Paenarthrobacter ilicis TaxID=43665 RepID=UPI0028D50FB7|nr:heparinase II/III family protein [Paenarthrobacter ilicis]
MKDISEIRDQLFETYVAAASKKVSPADHIRQLVSGRLTLPPHDPQTIGPDFSWSADPISDANWRFQYHTLLWLDNLRSDSLALDSKEGIALYERLLKSWVDGNPVDDGASDYSWFDMAVGVRAIVLVQALEHLGPLPWLVESIEVHGKHLADEDNYEGKGNHSLHQDMGLVVVAQLLERPDWLALAADRIGVMFEKAIDHEGVSREGSIDYQYRNFRWYEEAARRLKIAGVDLPGFMEERLSRMPDFMAHATSPSTFYALLGDTILHRAPIIEGTSTNWVKDLSVAPKDKVAVYESGYLFARNKWSTWREELDSTYLTMRFGAGRATAVHGHEDAGSITFDAHGERILCDSGLYAYEAGEDRVFFRGRSAHNVVDIPGRQYYPSATSPLIAHQQTQSHVMTTVKVSGLQGAVWHRTVLHSLERGYIIVDDRVNSHFEGPFVQRWQLPESSFLHFNPDVSEAYVRTPQNNDVQFVALGFVPRYQVACGNENPLTGWRSEEYRVKRATPEFSVHDFGKSTRFSMLIHVAPAEKGAPIEVLDVERTSRELRATLKGAGWTEKIRLSSEAFDVIVPSMA